ncbi:MAG: hemin ABC transporter substrate-binding protein [Candidatus Omnitrophica bacterium]|nr:hemin ABC transporter substrate-binding protein [Candidatus Omnitrophota bacterium]
MKKILSLFCVLFLLPANAGAQAERIVSVDGAVTEIIYALGEEGRLAGVDTTSVFPESVHRFPKVGYKRALSAEGILSLSPDLVIATAAAGPPAVLKQIEEAGVKLVRLPEEHSLEGIYAKVTGVAEAIGVPEKGAKLVEEIKQQAAAALAKAEGGARPKVLFVFHAATGSPLVAGTHTAADAMIKYAGGDNVVKQFEGYKPLNPEFLAEADPDILLTTDMVLDTLGDIEAFKGLPGISLTRAARENHVVVMNTMYLLGFTPRTPQAIGELSELLNSTP